MPDRTIPATDAVSACTKRAVAALDRAQALLNSMARRPKTWPIFVPWAEGPLDTGERVRNLAWAIEFNRRATTPGMTKDTLSDPAMVLWVDTVFRFEELLQNIGHGLPYGAVEAAIPVAAREMFEREVAGLSDGEDG